MRRVGGTGTKAVPRAVLLTLMSILAAQAVGWIRPAWYPMTLGASLAVVDALGVFYLLRVARLGYNRLSCRVGAVARGIGVLNGLAFMFWAAGGAGWVWWFAAFAHVAGMALLGFSTVLGPLARLSGPHRQAFAAEMVAVGAAAVMIIWCVGLDPALWSSAPDRAWIILAGLPIADLMLAMAIAAMLMRGMVTHWRDPISVLLIGCVLAILTDTAWVAGLPAAVSHAAGPGGGIVLVGAHVLLTLSPLMSSSGIGSVTDRPRRTGPPRWVAFLPLGALVSGVALLLGVIVAAAGFLRWSGLIVATVVMIAAVAVRQWLELSTTQARASRDLETGLASRAALKDALAGLVRARETYAVLAIAVPPGGPVAEILRSCVRADDLVARLGQSTFGVVLTEAAVDGEATTVAQRILASVPGRCSIGLAVARVDEPARTVLRSAEIALNHARRAGTSTFVVHEPSMNDRRAADAALAEALEGALARDEFTVLYQPIIDLPTRRVVAVEALLRWHHPLHGDVSPGAFIPVAERSGEIVAIGRWVLERACAQAVRWSDAGIDLTVTVNVSPRQLQEAALARDVLDTLERTGLPAGRLVVEVTESAMVNEAVEIAALRTLRAAGVRIAIDDFGTGYSSLQYLTRLPVDVLKIDRSFVAQLDGTTEGSAIAEAVVRLAQILRLTTVAEGIENEQQARELVNLGSQRGQGFLFSRPVPADDIPELAADVTYTGFQQLSA